MSSPAARLATIVDEPQGAPRTTATLVASLCARLQIARSSSSGEVLGSIVAGFCALGRDVSETAAGARLRIGLARGRAGSNGQLLWQALGIAQWASSASATPVLPQVQNDVALLLTPDLEATLAALPIPARWTPGAPPRALDETAFLDFTVGMWAYAKEVAFAIEALAEPMLPPPGSIERSTSAARVQPAATLLR